MTEAREGIGGQSSITRHFESLKRGQGFHFYEMNRFQSRFARISSRKFR